MRVIQTPNNHKKNSRTANIKKWIILGSIALFFLLIFMIINYWHRNIGVQAVTLSTNTNNKTPLDNLTQQDFMEFLKRSVQPNTKPIVNHPAISGINTVDERIKKIAESRGYVLTRVPSDDLNLQKIDDTGISLQALAKDSWQKMKQEAVSENVPLFITKGYVPIQEQKEDFLKQLQHYKISNEQITSGLVDDIIVKILEISEPPGYSWNHNGYSLTLGCGSGEQDFVTTTCYKWLSQNNYFKTKKFGWIPVYIDNDKARDRNSKVNQFVWVGSDTLLK